MGKTITYPYDIVEHLRTPEEMAAYLEACLEEADGDAAFVAKALGDIARQGHGSGGPRRRFSRESLYKAFPETAAQVSTRFSRSSKLSA